MTDVLDDASGDVSPDKAAPDNPAPDHPEAEAEAASSPEPDAALIVVEERRPEPASWAARAVAFSIDVLLGGGVVLAFMMIAWSAPLYGWVWWLSVLASILVFFAIAANRLVLPVITGWSLGRSIVGIKVVRQDGRPLDPWFLLLRDLAHILDTLPLLLGWFWPLVDSRRRTFADILTRTEVHRVEGVRPDYRPIATKAIAALAGLALLSAVLGYLGVYRQERAVAQAREQIAEEGPKIVPDVLSYAKDTVDADFTQAQALVTDSYRPQLVAQQEAVRKAGAITDNEYWVTNSAVLSNSADHAQMLLLMQGQRGAAPKQRFITATVRASFVKSGSQWQVSDLAVIAKPAPPQQAQPAPPQPGKPVSPEKGKPSSAQSPEPTKPEPNKPGESAAPQPNKPEPSKPEQAPPSPTNPPKQGQ